MGRCLHGFGCTGLTSPENEADVSALNAWPGWRLETPRWVAHKGQAEGLPDLFTCLIVCWQASSIGLKNPISEWQTKRQTKKEWITGFY